MSYNPEIRRSLAEILSAGDFTVAQQNILLKLFLATGYTVLTQAAYDALASAGKVIPGHEYKIVG